MNPGRLKLKLFGFLAVVLVLVGITLVQGKEPLLGLDLQGGISVTLEPVGNVREGSLDVALDVIRSNVDSLGVAEPEINRQGPFTAVQFGRRASLPAGDRELAAGRSGPSRELEHHDDHDPERPHHDDGAGRGSDTAGAGGRV
jgi:preprotein translocase subunit SecD